MSKTGSIKNVEPFKRAIFKFFEDNGYTEHYTERGRKTRRIFTAPTESGHPQFCTYYGKDTFEIETYDIPLQRSLVSVYLNKSEEYTIYELYEEIGIGDFEYNPEFQHEVSEILHRLYDILDAIKKQDRSLRPVIN